LTTTHKLAPRPKGALSSRELLELSFRSYVAEHGAQNAAQESGISLGMIHRILRGERQVSGPIAAMLGYDRIEEVYYVRRGAK
jgi:hypothetical protein